MTALPTPPYGSGRVIETYTSHPVRMWTVPNDAHVAWPTPVFYNHRTVIFSNEGNTFYPRWVALDRYNDVDWADHDWEVELDDLAPLMDHIVGSAEGFALALEPTIHLAPAPVGAPWMTHLVTFLSRLF